MSSAELSNPSPPPRIALHERAGIDVTLDPESLTLHFGGGVVAPDGEVRVSQDLAPVLREPEAGRADDVLYTVYRGVAPAEAADLIAARGLEYVALAMRGGTIGRELTRTRGHVNNAAPGTAVAYPEVHEIWYGRALLYLQKRVATDPEDVCVMPLAAGDAAVVAPGWASLLVNRDASPLVVGSWRMSDCLPQHTALESLGGMAHFVVASTTEPEGYAFEPNPCYPLDTCPAPRIVAPHDLADFGLKRGQPMLTAFRRNPDFLRFLPRPQDYARVWSRLYAETEG